MRSRHKSKFLSKDLSLRTKLTILSTCIELLWSFADEILDERAVTELQKVQSCNERWISGISLDSHCSDAQRGAAIGAIPAQINSKGAHTVTPLLFDGLPSDADESKTPRDNRGYAA